MSSQQRLPSGYFNNYGGGTNGPGGSTYNNDGRGNSSSSGNDASMMMPIMMNQQQQQQHSHQLSSLQFHQYNMEAASKMSSNSAAQLLSTAHRMSNSGGDATNFMGVQDASASMLGQFQSCQPHFSPAAVNHHNMKQPSQQQQQQLGGSSSPPKQPQLHDSPNSSSISSMAHQHQQTKHHHPPSTPQQQQQQQPSPFVFDGYAGWVCRHCSHLTHYYRGPNYVWMGGQQPPPQHFVEAHLRICPAVNNLPWASRGAAGGGGGGSLQGIMGGSGGQSMQQQQPSQQQLQSNVPASSPIARNNEQQQEGPRGPSSTRKRKHEVSSNTTNHPPPSSLDGGGGGRELSILQAPSLMTTSGDATNTSRSALWPTNNTFPSSGMFSQWPTAAPTGMGGMPQGMMGGGGGGMPQGMMGMSTGMNHPAGVGGGGGGGVSMNPPPPSERWSPPHSTTTKMMMMQGSTMVGDTMPPPSAAATPAAASSKQPGVVHTSSIYPQSSQQQQHSTNMNTTMAMHHFPPPSSGTTKKQRGGTTTTTTPKKVKPTPIHTGIDSTDEDYSKALSLLRTKAAEMPPLPPSITGCNDDKISLIEEGDATLLTDYFYYIMLQLSVCRLTEKDRKTRGGKRQDVAVGYGGLQCVHCATAPSARKFFWSNVDRLANSFAGIPDHVLTCKMCPKDVVEALLVLKGRHNVQMSCLTRGSQKHFFRRMWKRLHDGDGVAAAAGAAGGGDGAVAGGAALASLKGSSAATTGDVVESPPSLGNDAAAERLSLDSDAAAESLKKSVTQSPPDEENDGSSVPSPQDKTDNGPAYIPV